MESSVKLAVETFSEIISGILDFAVETFSEIFSVLDGEPPFFFLNFYFEQG